VFGFYLLRARIAASFVRLDRCVACFLRPPAGASTDSVSVGPPRPRPHLDLQSSFAGTLVSCVGDVPSITIGSWRWSCATDCLGSTCGLSPDVGAVYSLNGTLPEAIGSLSCRSKIKIMCETTLPFPAGGPAGAALILCVSFHDVHALSPVHV
jgi:hypothetical protein